jgi:hypothetical protein
VPPMIFTSIRALGFKIMVFSDDGNCDLVEFVSHGHITVNDSYAFVKPFARIFNNVGTEGDSYWEPLMS